MTDDEAQLERLLQDLNSVFYHFHELCKKLKKLTKVIPTITKPVSGGPRIGKATPLPVQVTSNYSFTVQPHDVFIKNAGDVEVPGTRVAVSATGTATIPLNLKPLAPDTDYILVCDAGSGASLPFAPHFVAIRTGP